MKHDTLKFVEVQSMEAPLLVPWCDLYERAFPPEERMLMADILRVVREKACGNAQDSHFLAVTDADGRFVALAYYEVMSRRKTACLWYLAVVPELRSRGIGSTVYRHILRDLRRTGLWGAVFEVEIPEDAHSEEARVFAQRRIELYRRLGARLLTGIRYTQSVGSHQPPIPMHLMVHPFAPLTPEEAYRRARLVFRKALRRRRGESLQLR